jgi:hypothetical protein
MHLLEAVTELLEAARANADPAAEAIESVLRNQLRLVVTKGIVRRGRRAFCSRGYARDWAVIEDREIDFGHDIEVVFLAMGAARALGLASDRAIVDRLVSLGRSVTALAYDREHGKWLYSGNPITGKVAQRLSSIWANFEALNGLATLYDLTADVAYFDKFERVLRWLELKQANPRVGEWYYTVDDAGRPVDHDVFGNDCAWMSFAWKSSYHTLRALMARKHWLEDLSPSLAGSGG